MYQKFEYIYVAFQERTTIPLVTVRFWLIRTIAQENLVHPFGGRKKDVPPKSNSLSNPNSNKLKIRCIYST